MTYKVFFTHVTVVECARNDGCDAPWRNAEFVMNCTGNRPEQYETLHRPACSTLGLKEVEKRQDPLHVYEITLEKFQDACDQILVPGPRFKICRKCCDDILIVGPQLVESCKKTGLTRVQLKELDACARKPQSPFGRGAQNSPQSTLLRLLLCEDVEIDGLTYCQATPAGKDVLIRAGVRL